MLDTTNFSIFPTIQVVLVWLSQEVSIYNLLALIDWYSLFTIHGLRDRLAKATTKIFKKYCSQNSQWPIW